MKTHQLDAQPFTRDTRAAVLAAVAEAWAESPYLRLGQFLSNATMRQGKDRLFQIQNSDLVDAMDDWVMLQDPSKTAELRERMRGDYGDDAQ